RPLERGVWERRTVCVTGFHPADASFVAAGPAGMQSWTAPDPLSADGRYCAGARGLQTSGEPGVDESIPVDTLPDVTSGTHVYAAPTEITPFSYKIALDLSIPVPDLCQDAMGLIDQTVQEVVGARSPVRKLPGVDLSTQTDGSGPAMPCHQWLYRRIDAV